MARKNEVLEAALRYARMGWPVLPLAEGRKVPRTKNGVHDATTDETTIRQWFEGNDSLNLAIATGQASGVVVVDVDPRNGGDITFSDLVADFGPLEGAWTAKTAGGGEHYFLKHDDRLSSRKLARGVDLLSDGRYVVVEPSRVDGVGYYWLDEDEMSEALPSMPDTWMSESLQPPKKPLNVEDLQLPEGSRNDGLMSIAGALRMNGLSRAEIFATLSVANDIRCKPPLPTSEVGRIADSASRYGPERDIAADGATGAEAARGIMGDEAPKTDDFQLIDMSTLTEPAPPKWLIRRWLPETGLAMMHGPSGAGKSFAALDFACHVASGTTWWGCEVKAGPVVYLCGEGHYGLRARYRAWSVLHEMVPSGLWLSPYGVSLDKADGISKALQSIESIETPPRLIIVDTLHRHMEGDENSAQDAGRMVAACEVLQRAFGCIVLVVHHTGVNAEAQHRARGSSAWKGALDAEFSVVPKKKGAGFHLVCRKQKDAEEPPRRTFRLSPVQIGWRDEYDDPVEGAAPTLEDSDEESDSDPEPVMPLSPPETAFLDALLLSGGQCKAKRDSGHIEAFLAVYDFDGSESSAKRARVRAAESLLASGLIREEGDLYILDQTRDEIAPILSRQNLLQNLRTDTTRHGTDTPDRT